MNHAQYKVLHVDDDLAETRMLGSRLRQHGITVRAINDPKLALDLILREQFHVVLLDIDMPRVNGLDLLEEIKRMDGGVNVIMVTAVISMTTTLRAMRRGASACFFKPIDDIAPLVEAIEAEFTKIDRWWSALKQLAEVARRDSELLDAPQHRVLDAH